MLTLKSIWYLGSISEDICFETMMKPLFFHKVSLGPKCLFISGVWLYQSVCFVCLPTRWGLPSSLPTIKRLLPPHPVYNCSKPWLQSLLWQGLCQTHNLYCTQTVSIRRGERSMGRGSMKWKHKGHIQTYTLVYFPELFQCSGKVIVHQVDRRRWGFMV